MAAPPRDNVKHRPSPPPVVLPPRFSERPPAAHRRQISAAGRILHCRARGAQPAALHGPPQRWLDGATFQRPPRSLRRDRKSTRLNSSHRTISYAVFCLKKKKKTKKQTKIH